MRRRLGESQGHDGLTIPEDAANEHRQLTWIDPVLTAEVSAVCGLACVLTSGPLRWVTAVLLVMYLPGRAIRNATRWNPPDRAVAWAVDVGLSLSLVVLAGMALNATHQGIQLSTMLPVLVGFSIVASLAGLARRSRLAEPRRPTGTYRFLRAWAVPITVFVLLAAGAVVIATRSAESSANRVKTTGLSIERTQRGLADVTVTNARTSEETYGLVVSAPGEATVIDRIRLPARQTHVVKVSTGGVQGGNRITASLYVTSASWPFRQVWLALPERSQQSVDVGH